MSEEYLAIVDEAEHELRPILTELKYQGVKVKHYLDADDCVDDLLSGKKANIYILDIMLKSKSVFPDKITNQQLYTGLALAAVIREEIPGVPIVFHSSMSLVDGLRYTHSTIQIIGNSRLIPKHDISSPLEFWKRIQPIIVTGNASEKENKWFSAFKSSSVIKPGLFGIGFDVKRFIMELKSKRKSNG